MSSFTLSALCAALTCYTPSQLTRQSNSFIGASGVQRIIAGSTYQIAASGTSFAADQSWTLSSSNSVVPTPVCTYSAEASNNQCTWANTFTASTSPGVTITYTAHDNVTNRNATFTMMTVAAVPQQPSLSTSTETQYILTQSSSNDTCVLVGAPSSYTYEAADLPATWSGVWSNKPSYVRQVVVDSQTRSGLWSAIAVAGEKFDFHAVCYNTVGHSMPYSVYNLVAVGSATAPAPTLVSASSVSASSFRVTFQSPASPGVRGFYPDNFPVTSSCTLAYGPQEIRVTQENLNYGTNHVFNVNTVDLSVEVPFTISCVVGSTSTPSAPVNGRIAAVATGLSSSSGSNGWLSSSSAPVGVLSSSSQAPILLSSSSSAPALLSSSSSEAPVLLSSSSGAPGVSSSSGEDGFLSSSAVLLSSSSAAQSSAAQSSAAQSSSTGVEQSSTAGAPSSSPAAPSSSSSSAVQPSSTGSNPQSGSSSSSSANVVVSPIGDIPEGTVSVTFSIDVDASNVTETLVNALHTDISANIAAQYNSTETPLNATQVEPFVIVTVGGLSNTPRRLLANSVPVSFMVLGNITTVTGGNTNPSRPFNALSAATSVTTALQAGTFVSTETATLGVSVPQQTVEVLPVVAPSQPSSSSTGAESSTGFGNHDDSSSSGISDGAIAGAVIGSVLGAALLIGIGYFVVRSGVLKGTDPVTEANANDVQNKGPLPINFEENNVDMGYTDQPVRIHTDSPLAQPAQSPGTPPEVYSNDANDVQVTIETRD